MSPEATMAVKVLALVPYPLGTAPGQRYRIEQWAPYLREHGVEVTFAPFATESLSRLLYARGRYVAKASAMLASLGRRFLDAWRASDFDVVLVHREGSLVGPAWTERLARLRQWRLIYDFDDAVYLRYVSPTNRYLSYLKFPSKTSSLCRLAGLVFAGNEHLAEYARRYNRSVHVVPSTVSLRDYPTRPPAPREGPPIIGWTGSHSSVQYLRLVEGALRRVRERRPFRVVLIGAEAYTIPGVDVVTRRWNPATEAEDLRDFAVGIMPVPDEPWARGKCGMKAIQYMAVGVPAVVSPVGANRTIVRDGIDGFLAAAEDDWVRALDTLLEDESLRRRMGAAARGSVETRYSAEVQAPRVAGLIRSLSQ